MEKDKEITDVVFLVVMNPDNKTKEAVAYFPNEWWNPSCNTHPAYMHIGQHGAATEEWAVFSCDIPEAEDAGLVAELKAELEGIGYNLNVLDAKQWQNEKRKLYNGVKAMEGGK